MSIEKSKVIARIKALHPNTNLSNARLNELSDRLIKKLTDDADDAAIDSVINDANDYNPFSEIARSDDKIRDLESKLKPKPPVDDPKPDPIPDDISPSMKAYLDKQNELIEKLNGKLEGFEKGQQTKSITERFNSDERIKDVPDIMRRGFIPTSEDDYEATVTGLIGEFNKYNESYKVERIGNDNPRGQQGGDNTAKEASKEQVDAVASKLKI